MNVHPVNRELHVPEDPAFKPLIRRARSGDREAMDELLRIYNGQVMAIIRNKLGRKLRVKLDSMDIYQTAMKSAVRSIESFEGETPSKFINWLTGILQNDIKVKAGYFKKNKRDMDREQQMEWTKADHLSTPSQHVLQNERAQYLKQALSQLSENQRLVILLKKKGKHLSEIARHLDIGERTVSRIYSEAILAIRKFMEQRGYGDTQGP